MRYEPLISIMTLTYNLEDFIAECIESVLCQTYENWEMIILDDASTDKTPFVVEDYAKKDKRIKFIRNEKNIGIYNLNINRNRVLKEAKGEWIAYLDGDDVFTKRTLEYRIKALNELDEREKDKVALIHGNCGRIWMNSKILDIPTNPFSSYKDVIYNNPVGTALTIFLQGSNFIPSGSVMIRKSVLEEIGGFIKKSDIAISEDFQTWCYIALKGKFLFVDAILYFWRKHKKSLTMNHPEKFNRVNLDFIYKFYKENKEIMNSLSLDLNLLEKCLGIQSKLELAKILTLKGQYTEAKRFLKQIDPECFRMLPMPNVLNLKYKITKLANLLHAPFILNFSLRFKRKIYDKIIGSYYPFFFKELDI